MRHVRNIKTFAVAWVLAAMTAACSSELSLDASAAGEARILMSRSDAPATSEPSDTIAGARSVDEDTVQSLKVTVVAVEFLAAGDSSGNGGWVSVNTGSSFDLDLMSLSTGTARLIAQGSVAAGAYTRVRLRVTNPRITFKGDVSFGAGGIIEGGSETAIVIPSSQQVGLEAGASFTIEASTTSDVALVFECARTLGQVAVTGTGQVIMSPVLRAE